MVGSTFTGIGRSFLRLALSPVPFFCPILYNSASSPVSDDWTWSELLIQGSTQKLGWERTDPVLSPGYLELGQRGSVT